MTQTTGTCIIEHGRNVPNRAHRRCWASGIAPEDWRDRHRGGHRGEGRKRGQIRSAVDEAGSIGPPFRTCLDMG